MSLRTTIPPDPPFPIPTIYDSDALRAYWSTSHVLGVQIKPGFTDADRSSWPTNIERIVDEDGNVNYFTEANHKRLRDWKRKLGRLLVEEIVKPELKRRNSWETCELPPICVD